MVMGVNATHGGPAGLNASASSLNSGMLTAPLANSSTMLLPTVKTLPQPSGWGNYFQAIGVLLLVLGILYMGVWTLKRLGKLRGFGSKLARDGLTVEGQFHLGPKKTLVVVRFLNKRLLLGVTDHHINLLTEMEANHDATQNTSSTDFRDIMDEAGNKDSSS